MSIKGRAAIKKRILTALVALPLLVFTVYYTSQGLFAGLIFVLSALALHEFYAMSLPVERGIEKGLSVIAGVCSCVGIVHALSPNAVVLSLALPFLSLLLVYLFRFHNIETVCRDLAISLLGILYIPLLLSHVVLLRALPAGRDWIFLVLLVVMTSDTFAYFIGMNFGKHHLYKAVSPNKTIEGAIGGLAGAILGATLCKFWFFPGLSAFDVIAIGLGVGAISQLGDLFESLMKRSFGVKDSGSMIPGHGGLLDRLDSLLFAFPITFYYAVWAFA